MSDHHVRWSSFQWWTSLCWSYLLYDSRSTFRSQCSEAISAYARLVKFNPSILRVQNWLAPVVCAKLACSRHDELSKRCILRENTYTLKFSERSSYNATVDLSKIRCIKNKHHMQSYHYQYKWYDMAIIILCLWSPSPKHHHDHHHHRRDTLITIAGTVTSSLSSRQSYASTTITTA